MPIILPYNSTVTWPEDEGSIGVIGVAPWATINFLNSLYSKINATKDWQFPRVICDINTKLPSRGRYLELNERNPSPFIAKTIMELSKQGATVAVVPCNTAHILYEEWAKNSPIPVPNIIEVTCDAIYKKGAKKVLTLSSINLYKYKLYENELKKYDIESVKLTKTQISLIGKAIEEVKISNSISENTKNEFNLMIEVLLNLGLDGIILGCTELTCLTSILTRHVNLIVNSNDELAKEALNYI